MAKTIRWAHLFALVMLLASILWAQGKAPGNATSGNAPTAAKRTTTPGQVIRIMITSVVRNKNAVSQTKVSGYVLFLPSLPPS